MGKSLIFFWIGLNLTGRAFAADLDWDQLLKIALESSDSFHETQNELRSKQYLLEKSKSNFFPELAIGMSSKQTKMEDTTQTSQTSQSASWSINQNIFNGFRDQNAVFSGQKRIEQQQIKLDKNRQKILNKLKKAAAFLIFRRDLLQLSKEIAQRQNSNQRIVELRFEVGKENKGSVLLSKANSKDADFEVDSAMEKLQASEIDLRAIAGLTSEQRFTGRVPSRPPTNAENINSLIENTYLERELKIEEDLYQLDIDQAKGYLWPSINLSASSISENANFLSKDRQSQLLLSMNLSLFNGWKDFNNIESLQAQKLANSYRQKGVRLDFAQSLRASAQEWRDTYRNLEIAKSYVEAQSLRTEIARSKYANGLLSFDEWNLIEKELIQQQKAFINAELDIVNAETKFDDLIVQGAP